MCEREGQKNVVKCDAFDRAAAGGADEQQDHVFGTEVLGGEDSIFDGGEEGGGLLYDVRDQADAKSNPQSDHCWGLPGLWGTEDVGAVVSRANMLQCMAASIQWMRPSSFEAGTSGCGVNEGKTNT